MKSALDDARRPDCDAPDCASPDAVHRTAWLLPAKQIPDVLTVRARMRIIRHPPNWGFPELVEYRLLDAVEVGR